MRNFNKHIIDTKDFWNKKIRQWEIGRYDNNNHGGVLEKIANYSSNSLRNRLRLSAFILKNYIKNKTVIEIGCGSALMGWWFVENGAKKYIGYDIAASAIEHAKTLYKNTKYQSRVKLFCKPILEMDTFKEADIILSLGLLDWLTDDELKKLFSLGKNAEYLHAISEKRISLTQYLHRIYVHLSYGFKTDAYVPRYFSVNEIKALITYENSREIKVFRDNRLSFGALLSSIPLPRHQIDLSSIPYFSSNFLK